MTAFMKTKVKWLSVRLIFYVHSICRSKSLFWFSIAVIKIYLNSKCCSYFPLTISFVSLQKLACILIKKAKIQCDKNSIGLHWTVININNLHNSKNFQWFFNIIFFVHRLIDSHRSFSSCTANYDWPLENWIPREPWLSHQGSWWCLQSVSRCWAYRQSKLSIFEVGRFRPRYATYLCYDGWWSTVSRIFLPWME